MVETGLFNPPLILGHLSWITSFGRKCPCDPRLRDKRDVFKKTLIANLLSLVLFLYRFMTNL